MVWLVATWFMFLAGMFTGMWFGGRGRVRENRRCFIQGVEYGVDRLVAGLRSAGVDVDVSRGVPVSAEVAAEMNRRLR